VAGRRRAAFVWQLTHNVEFWMPTPEEQDARYQEVFREGLERKQFGDHAMAGWRALGGG
jgi:hypothetical protein